MIDAGTYRAVIGRLATGVCVITAEGPGGPVGMTANAVCSVSLDPLLLLVCFAQDARTLPIVRQSGAFGVNVLAHGQEELARLFASKAPEHEKFAGIGHRVQARVPVIDGVLAWLACDVHDLVAAGDHEIAIGSVVAGDATDGEPLLWYRGRYGSWLPAMG